MNKISMYTIISILTALYSVSAHSRDFKVIPGAICQPTGSNYAETNLVRQTSGGMFNNSTEKQTWICPLVRDLMAGGTHLFVHVKAKAYANTHNNMVKCSFNSRKEKGQYLDNASSSADRYQSTPLYQWNLSMSHHVKMASKGYFYARCIIPGKRMVNGQWLRSGINSIKYFEYD